MRIAAYHRRLWILSLVLLIGFAVRLHDITIPNLNIDETWTYVNSFYLANDSGYAAAQILAPEPNNALHLVLVSLNLRFLPGAFGARWLSVIAGVLTIALTARIAFRLYGQRAALIAPLIAALAYVPVTYSQIARPYALATMLALLSLLFWLEKRPRLNMVVSPLVPFAHIGAMPVVVIQDLLTLWNVWRGQSINKTEGIVRRIPVYTIFLLVVYLTYRQRIIHVISSGQPAPSPADLLNNTLNVMIGGFPALTAGTLLFLVGVVVPVVLLAILYWRHLPKNLGVPLTWIAATYMLLIAGAVLSDGPIKWIHITHVAIALALLIAGLLAQAPRAILAYVLGAFCIASAASLITFYQYPYHYWSDALAEINTLRQGDELIYLQQPTVLWSFQINNPSASHIYELPAQDARPSRYLYVEMSGWLPVAPPECAAAPLWSKSDGLRLLACDRE